MTMQSRSHAFYAPSSMQRLKDCPGSGAATAGMPEEQSDYGKDGTEAHTLLAWALHNKYRDAETAFRNVPTPYVWLHRKDTYAERIDSVQLALDEIWEILDSYEDAQLFIETRVHFPSAVTTECWGTADIVIVVPSMNLVYIIDYKHGAGVYVEVEENLQCGTYATSVLTSIPAAATCETVVVVIIQPRAFSPTGPIRRDVQSGHYFREFFRAKIDNIIWQSQQPNAPLVPGEKQCQFCPIRAQCPAREAAALAVVNNTFKSFQDVTTHSMPIVKQMTPDRVSFILHAKSLMQGWFRDVEAYAFELSRSGTTVPGFKIVEASPRRKWYDEDPQSTALMLMSLTGCGEDAVFPRTLITITEADKLVVDAYKARAPRGFKKQAAEEAKNALALLQTKETSGSLTMVADDDTRPAVNLAQKTFANVNLPTQGN